MQNKLSVIICTFKRPGLLENLLEDLIHARCIENDIEIVVVDNDSEQSAASTFSEFTIPHSKYVIEPVQNISAARNRGLNEASNEYILFLDDDQRVSPDFLEELLHKLHSLVKVDALRLPVLPIFSDSAPRIFHQAKLFGFKDEFENGVLTRDNMGTGGLVIRKAILEKNPFDLKWGLSGGEDIDLYTRFASDHWLSTRAPIVREIVPTSRMSFQYLTRLWRRKGQTDTKQDLESLEALQKAYITIRSLALSIIFYIIAKVASPIRPKQSLWFHCLVYRQLGKIDSMSAQRSRPFYATQSTNTPYVLHFTQHMELGGAEKLLEQIAIKHISKKVKIGFYFYNAKNESSLMKSMKTLEHPIFMHQKSQGIDLKIFFKLYRIVREQKISVIHCHDIGSLIYAIPLRVIMPSIKLVHTIHTLHNWVNHRRYKIVYAIASLVADRSICVAHHVRDTLAQVRGASIRKAVVVKNGVDLERFLFHPKGEENSLISVSRVSPEKNMALLLSAYAKLKQRHIGFKAFHLGSGTNQDLMILNEEIRKKGLTGTFEMLGFRNDVAEQIKKVQIFVTASKEECTPVSVLEAMAVGKICICSDIPAHRELPKGAVLLFPANDADELANTLEKVLTRKINLDHVRLTARKVVADFYNLKDMIDEYDAIYCSI